MFATEKELVETIKLHFKFLCDWNTDKIETQILEEVNLGFGIADLVISKIKSKHILEDIFSYMDIVIYKTVEVNPNISKVDIIDLTKADNSKIKKSLDRLTVNKYISLKDLNYRVIRPYKNVSTYSIAIEAKIRNWKQALNQAYRYKWFASRSYVIIDSKNCNPPINNIHEFKKLNVGLGEINKEGILIIHYKPLNERPIDEKMIMLLSEKIKLRLLT